MDYERKPLVIGSTAGEGTKTIAHICKKVGYYLGANLNESLDSLDFIPFYGKWINLSLSKDAGLLTEENGMKMFSDFQESVERHREKIPDTEAQWAWKNPRSMYLLPFFHVLYPEMKFIHVVRDGRDIAFSPDQNLLFDHTQAFFNESWKNMSTSHIAMLLWKATNIIIAKYGEESMGHNYMRIRLEDLYESPFGIVKVLLKFLNISGQDISQLASEVKQCESIELGIWDMYPVNIIEELVELGREGLQKFGYI